MPVRSGQAIVLKDDFQKLHEIEHKIEITTLKRAEMLGAEFAKGKRDTDKDLCLVILTDKLDPEIPTEYQSKKFGITIRVFQIISKSHTTIYLEQSDELIAMIERAELEKLEHAKHKK